LETQKKVKNVIYPTNHQGEIKERAKKYLNGGNGALVGADLGTAEAGAKFIDNLKML
jgi:O-acetylhomoserine (thiol)-lyase